MKKNMKHMGSKFIFKVDHYGMIDTYHVDYTKKFIFIKGRCAWHPYEEKLPYDKLLNDNLAIMGVIPLGSELNIKEILKKRGIQLKKYSTRIISLAEYKEHEEYSRFIEYYLLGYVPYDRGYLDIWPDDDLADEDAVCTDVHPYIY